MMNNRKLIKIITIILCVVLVVALLLTSILPMLSYAMAIR